MLVFERRGDKLGFRIANASAPRDARSSRTQLPAMDSLKQAVENMLIAQGLYHDEAQAMFETWRDSWFEEGSRLLYIVPRQFVDSVLPLSISPAPAQTVRVFVGRLELVTPATQRAVEQALATHDQATLETGTVASSSPFSKTCSQRKKFRNESAILREYLNNSLQRIKSL